MLQSEQVAELFGALAKAQSAMGAAKYNKQNPHFKNRYADLAAIIDVYRKPLSENGLNITQRMITDDRGIFLITTLGHMSGQYMASVYPLPPPLKPQEFGSALTYARRYSVSALLGIAAEEDDDGEVASKANGVPISEQQQQELAKRIAEVGLPIADFLKVYKIEAPGDLPASKYDDAMRRLDNYARNIKRPKDDNAATVP